MVKMILRNKLASLIYSLFTIVFILGSGATSYAASASSFDNGFTVSPVRNLISVAKGQTSIVPITVENPSQAPVTAQVIINDFLPSNDETGVPRIITNDNTTLPLDSFISLVKPIAPFYLGADQQQIINVTISVPKNAIAGDYYGAIRFAPVGSGSGVVALNATVATIFLLTVPGNLYQKLSLVQFSAADANGNASSFFSNGQLSMVTKLTNQGTTHSEPFGNIIVKSMFGKIVDNVQFNNTTPRASILTQSTRKFITQLKKQSWLGYYTATISIGYGNSLITSKTSFWYIPLWLEILVLVIIVLIVAGVVWLVRRRRETKFGRRIK
ncbi:MAG TPA: hypothetical protein VMQ58_01465 [Candidatus Saccharimonadales bacterium]|jgi:hypothetical protein|nr:hypothetical protein [Candidatus Saccharimonadales bacterium]